MTYLALHARNPFIAGADDTNIALSPCDSRPVLLSSPTCIHRGSTPLRRGDLLIAPSRASPVPRQLLMC